MRFAVESNHPLARSAGSSSAAAQNIRVAISRAFVSRMFDLPLPFKVLHAHAFVAALGVQRVITARFTRVIINAVDSSIVDTRSADMRPRSVEMLIKK
jgi:hypothetical protein